MDFTIPGMMPRTPVRATAHLDVEPEGNLTLTLHTQPLTSSNAPVIKLAVVLPGNKLQWADETMKWVFQQTVGDTREWLLHVPKGEVIPVGTSELQVLCDGALSKFSLRRPDSAWAVSGAILGSDLGAPETLVRGYQALPPGTTDVTVTWQTGVMSNGRQIAFQVLNGEGQIASPAHLVTVVNNTTYNFTVTISPAIPDEEGWQLLYIG